MSNIFFDTSHSISSHRLWCLPRRGAKQQKQGYSLVRFVFMASKNNLL